MKRFDFERHLKTNNCKLVREGGNHSIWKNTTNNKISPVPRHNEIKELTVKKICKQLEISIP